MTDILIVFKDYYECILKTSQSCALEISEEFSFFVKGYKFNPKFKSGMWDGKIRLYNLRDKTFPVGLIPDLAGWAKRLGYTIAFEDKSKFVPSIVFDPSWEDEWPKYGRFEPKSYQREAVKKSIALNRSIILSPTGSGKSYIIYLVVRYILQRNPHARILITVPRTSLVEQLVGDFKDYCIDGWNVDANCAMLYSGKEKCPSNPVVISTWQSVFNNPPKWFKPFDSYICDEVHGADSKSITGIVKKLGHTEFRLGLTGTLKAERLHELEMRARFGPVVRVATTDELIKSGDLSPLEIICVKLEYDNDTRKLLKKADYAKTIEYITKYTPRNEVICKMAMNTTGNVVIFFHFIEQGEELVRILNQIPNPNNKGIHYTAGSTKVQDREKIRDTLEKTSNNIWVASTKTTGTGTNVKNLHTLFYGHPNKAKIATLQTIGRTLRPHDSKKNALLVDFWDDLNIGKAKKKHVLTDHFLERLRIYEAERFPHRIIHHKINS